MRCLRVPTVLIVWSALVIWPASVGAQPCYARTAAQAGSTTPSPFDVAQYKGRCRPASVGQRFRFVIVGDRTGGHVPGLTEQGFKEINELRPEFVISVGDLIEGYVRVGKRYGNRMVENEQQKLAILTEQWQEFDKLVELLDAPFIYVPGNHDISDLTAYELYRKRYGPTYFSFDYKGVHFVCLNSEEPETVDGKRQIVHEITGRQLAWLKKDIDAHRDAKLILVFFHQPLWQYQGGKPFRKAEEVLAGTNYVVIAAHYHTYSYELRNDRPYIIVGPVGGTQASPELVAAGRFRHYTFVTVEDGQARFALVKLGGILSAMSVWRQDHQTVQKLYRSGILQRVETDESKQRVLLRVRNPLDTPIKVALTWGKDVGPWQIEPAKLDAARVPPGAERVFEFTARPLLPAAKAHDPRAQLTYWFTGRGGVELTAPHTLAARLLRRLVVPVAPGPIRIDADLADWPDDLPAGRLDHAGQVIEGRSAWQGPDDLSASFRAVVDGDRLCLAVVVTDDRFTPRSSKDLWRADSVEVLYSSGAPDVIVTRNDARFHQIIVAPIGQPSAPETECTTAGPIPKGFAAAYKRCDGGYRMELAVPLADLPAAGQGARRIVAFDLAVNDRDASDKRESQIVWSSPLGHSNHSTYFGRLVLPGK